MRTFYNIILDNILSEMKRQNKTQKELTDYLGITKNVFTDWKNGKNKSYMKHLPKIAIFLNVSVDYLLGKKETTTPTEQPLSLRDKYILSRFEGMSDEEVSKALDYLEKLKNQDN